MSSGPISGEQQDALFAQMAVKNGLLQSQQLDKAIELQRQLASRGEHRRLSSLLIQTGDLSASQVRQILSDMEKSLVACPGCGSTFNIADLPPGKRFICKRCKSVVIVPGGDAQATPPPHELARTMAASQQEDVLTPSVGASGPSQDGDVMGGRVVGNCRVERKLGAGGMGAVYLATQVSLGRPVALKILPKSLAENEEYIARFEREARAVALLNHPNTVQVYDMGKDPEGFYFIVMEFVDGTNLSDLWKEKGILEEKFALRAIRQACSGLQIAHEAGILHRDIKPENLMLSRDGRVKITDFGLAKETRGDSQLTGTGIALGTPAYMSPEQGLGETPDRRCDIYSLGGTLFTLLTAKLPYEAKSPLSMMMKHATDPVPRVREANPAVSQATEEVILKAMAKDRGDRFQDMNEMRDAVQKALEALSARGRTAVQEAAPPNAAPSRTARRERDADRAKASDKVRSRKGPALTPRTPPKAVTPARRGASDRKAERAENVEKAERTGRAEKLERTGRTPRADKAEETERPRRGPRRGAGTPSGRHSTLEKQGSGGKILAIAGGATVVVLLVVLGLIFALQDNGPAEDGEGNGNGSADNGGTVSPPDTDPDPGGKGGETKTPPPDEPPPDTPGSGTAPPQDEPEGPKEPPSLPHGIRKGNNPGEYINEKDGTILVYVPAGRTLVGLSAEELDWIRSWFPLADLGDHEFAQPEHSVYLDGFFIGKYEITNGQYEIFLDWFKKNPGERERYAYPDAPVGNTPLPRYWGKPGFEDTEAPVVGVDWFDAYMYARWAGLDLPTEAQWEKAARWDPATRQRRRFPWGDDVDPQRAFTADRIAQKLFTSARDFGAWFADLPEDQRKTLRPKPVRSSAGDTSPVGAVNMAGNVWEWCRDNYHFFFYGEEDATQRNAYDRAWYPGRPVRGGHILAPLEAFFHRVGWFAEPGNDSDFTGFRCAIGLVSVPEDVPRRLEEAELRALPLPVQLRTVHGMLESMSRENNHDGVVQRARWAVESFPEEASFYKRLGWGLSETGKATDAVYQFEMGVNLEKHTAEKAEFHVARGKVLLNSGDMRGGLAAFAKSIEINPHQFRAHYNLARAHVEKTKDYKAAIPEYEASLDYTFQFSEMCMSWHGLGLCHDRLGDLDASIQAFRRAVELNPKTGYVYDLGFTHLKRDELADAEKQFRRLLESEDWSLGYLGMARLFEKKGDFEKALQACEQGLAKEKTDSWGYNEMKKAREEFRKKIGK